MNKLLGRHKDKEDYCPKCNSDLIRGRSEQICEDGCEMWIECANCGWSGNYLNKVETVWGWQEEYLGYAFEAWKENIEEYRKEERIHEKEKQQKRYKIKICS